MLKELNIIIEEEKQIEINRINRFEKEESLEEKQQLENAMAKERAEANKRIKDIQRYIIYYLIINSEIECKLKKYEQKLNDNYHQS